MKSGMKPAMAILAVMLAVSLALAGCSKSEEERTQEGDGKKTSDKPVTLTLWGGYPEVDPWFLKMADEYRKDHPNVTVQISSFPLRDYEKKVAAALPSNTAANIITLDPYLAVRYANGDMLAKAPDDLANMVLRNGIYPEEISKRSVFNGTVYGVPYMSGKTAIYYNKKMFEEAGLKEPPKGPEQFLEYAIKTAKRDASGKLVRAGQSLRLSGGGSGVGEKFWIIMTNFGGTIVKEVSPGKYKAGYDNEAGLKTLKLYVDMVHKYKTDDPTLKHDAEAFELEQAAFFLRESWVIDDIAKKAPNLPYDTAPLSKGNVLTSTNFYVTNTDKSVNDTAWDFIRFMMKPENHKQMVEMSGWLPAREDLKMDDFFAKKPQFMAFFAKVENIDMYPLLPEFDEILTKFADRLATKGFTDPTFVDNEEKMKQFLAEAAKETNDILKRNGHLAE